MWSSVSVRKSIPAGTLAIVAGAVMFPTHMDTSTTLGYSNVFHNQQSSSYNNGRWVSIDLNKLRQHEEMPLVGAADIISLVKVTLGLPNKDIASIFGVTRQTLHAYANSTDSTQKVKSSTLERAKTLQELIQEVRQILPHSPGAMAKNYTADGCSLLDLLTADALDINKILRHSTMLAEKMNQIPSSSSSDNNTLYSLTRSA